MGSINFKREIKGELESTIKRLESALKEEGFGILTRIDFHTKMKEKLNKDMKPVVILGACAPALAYEAFQKNTDVTSVIPCNAVVRDLGDGRLSVELAKPSAMMRALGDEQLAILASEADERLAKALEQL